MKFGMGCLLFIAGLALAIPVRGLAISLNWTWFVSPALHLPEISLLQGIGISIFLTVLTAPGMYGPLKLTEGAEKEGSTKAGWDDLFIYGILGPLLLIVLAWLWHIFIQGDHPWLAQPWISQPWP
jgi:hypothetical protein